MTPSSYGGGGVTAYVKWIHKRCCGAVRRLHDVDASSYVLGVGMWVPRPKAQGGWCFHAKCRG